VQTDDDFGQDDSPFAHVPMPGAGPSPLQEGTFTYDKLIASAGYGSLRGGRSRGRTVLLWVVGLLMLAGVLIPLVLSFVR
jgi:hypothetical protein